METPKFVRISEDTIIAIETGITYTYRYESAIEIENPQSNGGSIVPSAAATHLWAGLISIAVDWRLYPLPVLNE